MIESPPERTDASQDELYAFPYHHLVEFDADTGRGFRTGRWYPGGLRYAAYMLHVERVLGPERFESIVDVGCGDGWLAARLAKRFPERTVVGVDVSPDGLRLARSMPGRANLSFAQCDIVRETPPGAPYDCGTLIEVLEHVPVPEVAPFVAGLARLIRGGGKLFVTVPSTNLDIERIKRHHQHFTSETLEAALAPHFRPTLVDYVNRKGRGDRLIRALMANSVFALTHDKTLDFLFQQYMRRCFQADRQTGLRVFGVFERTA